MDSNWNMGRARLLGLPCDWRAYFIKGEEIGLFSLTRVEKGALLLSINTSVGGSVGVNTNRKELFKIKDNSDVGSGHK